MLGPCLRIPVSGKLIIKVSLTTGAAGSAAVLYLSCLFGRPIWVLEAFFLLFHLFALFEPAAGRKSLESPALFVVANTNKSDRTIRLLPIIFEEAASLD